MTQKGNPEIGATVIILVMGIGMALAYGTPQDTPADQRPAACALEVDR